MSLKSQHLSPVYTGDLLWAKTQASDSHCSSQQAASRKNAMNATTTSITSWQGILTEGYGSVLLTSLLR